MSLDNRTTFIIVRRLLVDRNSIGFDSRKTSGILSVNY